MTYHILAIDDEALNLKVIENYLDDLDYELLTALDGEQGWALLEEYQEKIDVILLDRMMPNMDGLEFMEKIKSKPKLNHIPVVMQTAAAERNQILEGIQAGVYYYLTKPYDEQTLLSIVNAAIRSYAEKKQLITEIKTDQQIRELVSYCRWKFQSFDDAGNIAVHIASYFNTANKIAMGLLELFFNAIEHGNLGISYHEKTQLTSSGKLHQEIKRRLLRAENHNKWVDVTFERLNNTIELTITDAGPGFDWKNYMEIDPNRVVDNHGRGIAISNMLYFDKLEYVSPGNQVVCTINTNKIP